MRPPTKAFGSSLSSRCNELPGRTEASVALWAFLHGAVALEAAQVLGDIKPASGLEFGFEAWLMAVSTRGKPVDALRIKLTKKRANKKVSARERSVRSGK
jgi:hypothetical protein